MEAGRQTEGGWNRKSRPARALEEIWPEWQMHAVFRLLPIGHVAVTDTRHMPGQTRARLVHVDMFPYIHIQTGTSDSPNIYIRAWPSRPGRWCGVTGLMQPPSGHRWGGVAMWQRHKAEKGLASVPDDTTFPPTFRRRNSMLVWLHVSAYLLVKLNWYVVFLYVRHSREDHKTILNIRVN